MIHKVILISIIAITINALHLPTNNHKFKFSIHQLTDININHLVQVTNKTIPQSIQTHLDLITNQITLLELTYKQVDNLSNVETVGTQGILVKCKNVSREDQIYMKHTLQNIDTDLWSVYFEIQQFNKQGGSTDQLGAQYQQFKLRKQALQNKNINFCPQQLQLQLFQLTQQQNTFSDISNNVFVSNLNANNNWTYGKISQQQYEINQFQFLLNNDVVHCPNDTPYCSKGKCINCKDNEVFYLDTGSCGACSNETIFNNISHICEININQTCSGNQIYNVKQKKCQCPSGLFYYDGQNCFSCFIPQFWNSKTKKCQSCQKGNYYSLIKETCLQCPNQSDFISSLIGCHDQCTLSKPFFNGSMCVSCPKIFNSNTKQCQDCPSGLVFNQDKGICVQKDNKNFKPITCDQGYVYNHQNGQCVKSNECSCPSNYIYNQKTSKCQCPSNLQFDTGLNCINCNPPSSWDTSLKKCVQPLAIDAVPIASIPITNLISTNITVTNGSIPLEKPAISSSTNISATVETILKCNLGEVWNNVSKTCVCTQATPYRTLAGVCIQCSSPQQWSQTLHKCLPPPLVCKSSFMYDPTTQTCVCPQDTPFNDGQKCQSCYLPMYWSNLDKQCKYCPQNNYFNPRSRKCEFCPQSRPLLMNHVCQACPQGTQYNSLNMKCENINCIGGATYSFQANDCSCPDSKKPFYNGKQCVSCLSPNRWDLASRSCVYGTPSLWNVTIPTIL